MSDDRECLINRLISNVLFEDKGCWTYTKSLNWGYGRIKIKGRMMRAHRVSYLLFVGCIPGNLEIDHLCRNKACINPTHLELVTHKINMNRRGYSPPTKDYCSRGHPRTPENLYFHSSSKWGECILCKKYTARIRYLSHSNPIRRRSEAFDTPHA